MQLENLLSMDQVQTITIVALFLTSTVGGGGLVAVNNEANENSEKVDTLAQATWDFVLAVEGMQNAFEDAFVEDSERMDAIEEKDDRTAENISSLLSQISTAESQVSTLESEVSSLNHRLNTSGIQNNPPIIFTDAVDTDLSPQQGFDGDSDDPSTPNFVRIILSAIDLDTRYLPDDITLPLLWLGIIINFFNIFTDINSSILGAIFGYGILWIVYFLFKLITGKIGMGHGDFKLLAVFGAWFGWQNLTPIIILSSITAILVATLLIINKSYDKNKGIPFGPYLGFAGWISMLLGPYIISVYLNAIM